MIIKKLILHNFRVFLGVHEIDLQPQTDRFGNVKPIILFGGLNGAGKTSILTAVRVALYGRQAFNRMMNQSQYIAELDSLIHKSADQNSAPDQASVELIFTHTQGGQEQEYSVIRAWKKGKKDQLSIHQNGIPRDELNYEQCQGFLSELIPAGIADLFFFDGEKIAELAEDNSGKVLQTAVKRLLGIDLVARLKSDLQIYLTREKNKDLPTKILEELKVLQEERDELDNEAELLREVAANEVKSITGIKTAIAEVEEALRSAGGEWAKTKSEEEAKVKTLDREKDQHEKMIRTELDGTLPLAFAPNVMKALIETLNDEASKKQKQSVNTEIRELHEQLKDALAGIGEISGSALQTIDQCFQNQLNDNLDINVTLDLSDRELHYIENQLKQANGSSWDKFEAARSSLKAVEEELDYAALNIARAPEKEQLQDNIEKIRINERKLVEHQIAYKNALNEAKQLYRKAADIARKQQKLHDKNRSAQNASEAVSNAKKALLLLDRFIELLTHSRVKTLESEFAKSYHKLARKDDLEIRAQINPKTFDVELTDEQGSVIDRKALSAGEKQIYAISVLEALGRTSGLQLPVIIDTPLGRLDSHHRQKLIQNYFPTASHQVVILSTDTEVGGGYFAELEDEVTNTYQIIFDGKTKSSTLQEGYFWQTEQQEAV